MGPEGRLVGVGDAGDDGPDEPGVQGLLEVHLLHGLHGLPLGEVGVQASDLGLGLTDELLVSGLLGDSLGINGCEGTQMINNYFQFNLFSHPSGLHRQRGRGSGVPRT